MTVNIFTVIFSLSRPSLIIIWIFIEINLLTFVSFLNFNRCKFQSMARVKYFCIQALFSVSFILFYLFFVLQPSKVVWSLFLIALIVKLGVAPFQSWFVSVIVKVRRFRIFWLSTFQKIIPLAILRAFLLDEKIVLMIIVRARLVAFISVQQVSLKKLLAYSSIFRLNWLLASILVLSHFWIRFLVGYGLILLRILFIAGNLGQRQSSKLTGRMNLHERCIVFLGIFSLMGMPPITIFFLKLKLLLRLIEFYFIIAGLITSYSIILIFIYIMFVIKFITQRRVVARMPDIKLERIHKRRAFMMLTFLRVFVWL